VIVGVIPVLFSVDWLIGRVRSGVNVMSDMLVAIMLDRFPTRSPLPRAQFRGTRRFERIQ
jgi:Na+/H+-dicarboxylate symporter